MTYARARKLSAKMIAGTLSEAEREEIKLVDIPVPEIVDIPVDIPAPGITNIPIDIPAPGIK